MDYKASYLFQGDKHSTNNLPSASFLHINNNTGTTVVRNTINITHGKIVAIEFLDITSLLLICSRVIWIKYTRNLTN